MQNLKEQMITGCKLGMWTVIIFAPLPHAVNFFSKTSDQYYIACAFLYFNMLQAIQLCSVQLDTINIHHKPQMLHLMEAAEKKPASFLLSFYIEVI